MTSTKTQGDHKDQAPMNQTRVARAVSDLGFRIWDFIGYWGLGIGYSPTERR